VRVVAALLLGLTIASADVAEGAVDVIANRTNATVRFEIVALGGEATPYALEAGDVLPISVTTDVAIRFGTRRGPQSYDLTPNSAYFFHDVEGTGLDLEQLGLHGHVARRPIDPETEQAVKSDLATVTVRIYVDEEERMTPDYWQNRLTKRVEAASAIFEKHCRVRFRVVAKGTWPSDDTAEDFQASLKNFERMVTAHPADVAIGFSSQYADTSPGAELGGTRAPFHPYVLIREGSPRISEPEKLEVLVHELGHFLGASHSPEPTSVMRPGQGDRRALLRNYRIGFDPVNTLVMYMIGEELRRHRVRGLKDLSLETRLELRSIYATLAQTLPKDPAGPIYVRLLGITDPVTPLEAGRGE
jgi:Metallo-peptidase family M12